MKGWEIFYSRWVPDPKRCWVIRDCNDHNIVHYAENVSILVPSWSNTSLPDTRGRVHNVIYCIGTVHVTNGNVTING